MLSLGKAGTRLHNETSRSSSSPQLYMQAYEIADDSVTDLLATAPLSQKPAVLETAQHGIHVDVCNQFS